MKLSEAILRKTHRLHFYGKLGYSGHMMIQLPAEISAHIEPKGPVEKIYRLASDRACGSPHPKRLQNASDFITPIVRAEFGFRNWIEGEIAEWVTSFYALPPVDP